jgi:hypothetical protein
MGSRLLRSEMLDSESVLSLPVEARWLFVTILLSADDLGIFEATSFRLARKADINRDIADKLLTMICDSDLIRLYEVDGKRFGFIPKFRQRIRLRALKHPLPPKSLMLDDDDALNKINDLASKVSANGGEVLTVDSNVRPKAEAKAEAYIDTSMSEPSVQPSTKVDDCPHEEIISLWADVLPETTQPRIWTETRKKSLRSRWREDSTRQELDWWRSFFGYIKQSDFLMGRVSGGSGKPFSIDLEWVCKESNFVKIIEGKYHNG